MLIVQTLMASAPDDEWLSLNADPGAASLSLYRKIVRGETFGRQAVKPAELRWLFSRAHQAWQTGSTFMNWPVIEALQGITFDALVYAAENGIPVDIWYINRAFVFTGADYRDETDRFMAGMRRNVDSTWAGFLLRPLSSGALNLEAFPDEAIARICTTERLKIVFPLIVRAQRLEPAALQSWAAETGLATDDVSQTVEVADISLRLEIRDNRFPQQPGTSWHAPSFDVFVTAGPVLLALGWNMFSALVRYMQARAWLGATHEWSARDSLVSLYIPRGEGSRTILGLDGVHIAMMLEDYLALETGFLAAMTAPEIAPELAELRALYGDL